MSFVISKDFAFSASHQLTHLPGTHQCSRLHGHNYVVRVELTGGPLDEDGFVVDYGVLGPFKAWLDAHLDHRHLNDVVDGFPTAEILAQHLGMIVLPQVVDLPETVSVAVGVSETPKTWAWWRP